ncbi:MAG: pyridoxamine kinase [Deltaproteobacteria bacterium]|jgi:pyridoxine kinase|nr:pyridoxamine kinase [Deltaproteobacteria bacterium]
MRSPVLRVAAIHDLSGFGRTSLTVVIPVLSAMGIQVCPLPTAALSTQTSGFDDFCFVDLSSAMRDFLAHWRSLGLRFDAVYSGFLGSPGQVETVAACIESCLPEDGLAVVDPVLGDNGTLDPTMSMEMVEKQRWLIARADCITPNLTEAALLLGEPMPAAALDQRNAHMETEMIRDWLLRLAELGPVFSLITSVPLKGRRGEGSSVVAYNRRERRFWRVDCDYIPAFYPGTGDTFTSVLTGSLLQGENLPLAMDRAVQFVTLGLRATFGYALPARDGIILEKVLGSLHAPLPMSTYRIL